MNLHSSSSNVISYVSDDEIENSLFRISENKLDSEKCFDSLLSIFSFYDFDQYYSKESKAVFQNVLEKEQRTSSSSVAPSGNKEAIAEILFDAKANAKVMFSKVSMHFNKDIRKKIFDCLDFLHDEDDWEEGERPINQASFDTFLQWCFMYKPDRLYSFGLSNKGNLIASWMKNDRRDSFILEFLPKKKIRWFLSERFDTDVDNSSGTTDLFRIKRLFENNRSKEWFNIWDNI
ncbi:hypothetical protein KJY73_20735 [Bowmanella sp. Y26]|uniref:hypothetical protein n=1 Tax=Bowmanella yangjiangensis TaxID=2811230 RepID=UPI001BDC5555|nr:hypothetical protein [Bowmanella yangjiangensis]MBT1066013.1 hypothetical protein [Bowmanella yangjiangensis]